MKKVVGYNFLGVDGDDDDDDDDDINVNVDTEEIIDTNVSTIFDDEPHRANINEQECKETTWKTETLEPDS